MKNRVIRVSDQLWDAATRKADLNNETIADVVRRALAAYVEEEKR